MPTYIGFSTIDINQPKNLERPGVGGGMGSITHPVRVGRKFRLTDDQLVIRDLLNALSINQGDKVGQPQYGTTLRTYLYEQNTEELRQAIEDEVRRVASLDPRIDLQDVTIYEQDNGILLEVQMFITPYNNEVSVGFFLNRYDGSIQQLSQ